MSTIIYIRADVPWLFMNHVDDSDDDDKQVRACDRQEVCQWDEAARVR